VPELPDVEVFRRYVEASSRGRWVDEVEVLDARVLGATPEHTLRLALRGRELTRVDRHGKWLFAQVDGGPRLAVHFGMTGRPVHLEPAEPAPAHVRLVLRFAGGDRLVLVDPRRFGRVELAEDPGTFARLRGLGPDALAVDRGLFVALLSRRRGSVKAALLDQRLMAGIGNIYADEILFQAGMHPRRDVAGLDATELCDLHRIMRRVLQTAVDRDADSRRYPRGWLLRRRGPGGACPRCGTRLERIVVAGRGTYLCPRCQRRRAAAVSPP
jgi:formamidopyrimidine-DNA glycosylase